MVLTILFVLLQSPETLLYNLLAYEIARCFRQDRYSFLKNSGQSTAITDMQISLKAQYLLWHNEIIAVSICLSARTHIFLEISQNVAFT